MNKKNVFYPIAIFFLTVTTITAQSDIIINEIMYAPSTGEPEWVEIYNRSANIFDLANWKLSDALNARLITTKSISIGPGEFVILTQDSSVANFFNITTTIIPLDSWSGLNNSGDEVILLDNNSQTIDSLKYTPGWGGNAGKSLERINANSLSQDQNNWATTISPNNGTPGYANSVSPKEDDVAVNEIVIVQNPPIEGEDLSTNVEVKNYGTKAASSFSISLYNDSNFNSIAEPEELISSKTVTNLASDDSSTQVFSIGTFTAGNLQLIGVAELGGDQFSANDTLIKSFTILPSPPPFNAIVINELMYAPPTGQPEWVEIFNRSNTTYDLSNWQFSDGTSISTVTTGSINIAPNEFVILTDDSSIVDFYNTAGKIIVMDLPSLNNSGDRTILMNEYSIPVDSFTYSNSWGGSNDKSLERIDVNSPSTDQNNWGSSVNPNNATPGRINSLSPKNFDLTISSISILPDPAFENIDITAAVEIANLGEQTANSFFVNLYNDRNFDDIPQSSELISSYSLQNLGSGNSVNQLFDLGLLQQGTVRLIGIVNFGNDEDNSNDTLALEFTVNPPPPPFNSIVINEIMYAPSTGQPEWVELYNNSNTTFNLADWKFADGSTESIITSEQITIAPSEYLLLAKDASIQNYFNINTEVIVMNLPSLNNSGDRAILMDSYSIPIDSLTYSSSWGGTNGKSLERINVNESSNNPLNWGTSQNLNNATPGSINSLSPKNFDLAISKISISSVPAIENTDLNADVQIINYGSNAAASYSISLYNDENLNSIADPNELINSVTKTNLASRDSATQNFDLGSFSIGSVQLIATITFSNDEDPSNNIYIHEFTIIPTPPSYNAIVINEIMFSPPTGQSEWIEIYNRSINNFNLANWKFADNASVSTVTFDNIEIAPAEFIVIANDSSILNHYNIDARLIVADLPILNDGGDKAILMDSYSVVIDSLTYSNSWGGNNGRSLERIDFNEVSYDPQNWGTSISTNNATPGDINSISPKGYDLGVSAINILPSPPVANQELTSQLSIVNYGSELADNFTLSLYNDKNFNSIGETNELVSTVSKTNLASGDSLFHDFLLGSFDTGSIQLIAMVDFDKDENNPNNILIYEFSVRSPPPPFNAIVINEIMYAPSEEEPEWIEIYNRSTNTYKLTDWELSDLNSTATISLSPIEIQPNEYIVLTKDSSLLNYYFIESKVVEMNLPTLNNSGDNLYLKNNNSFIIDSLEYSSNWGGSNGRSLERIDAFALSSLAENWSESVSPIGATPGKPNSVIPREFDLTMLAFNSTSTFLFVNEENTLNAIMRNNGAASVTNAAMDIYLDSNGDSLFTPDEVYTSFENLSLASGETYSQNITFTFTTERVVNFLAVTRHSSDQYSENDSLFLSGEVINPAVTRGEIVINEFMYAPTSPYPEWIELFNTADIPQQLRNFSIADSRDTVLISSQNILLSENSYIIIARDSIMAEIYDIPEGVAVIIKEFPALNNSGDKLMLLDNYSRVIDSLEYSSEWGGDGGRTLERINPFGNSSNPDNWVTSSDPNNGTPGRINSIAPKDFDVAINEFYSVPSQPVSGETVNFFADIENKGVNAVSFPLELYSSDADSSLISLLETLQMDNLNPGETRSLSFTYKIDSFSGDQFFLINANFPQDLDTTNNTKIILVAASTPPLSLVINEIMYDPDDDEPEWVELYNRSSSSINLKDWRVSDVLANPEFEDITVQDVFVEPGEFIVLSKDSGIFNYHPALTEGVILVPFANLNNTVDGVVIYDRLNVVIDSVFYSNNFPGKSGYSIERLSTEAASNDPNNWNYSISAEKGTPGFINSRIPKDHDLVLDEINLNPEFPELGNSISISVSILNAGVMAATSYTVTLVSSELNINETISGSNLAPEKIDTLSLPSSYSMPESFSITATINYTVDENSGNNIATKTFYSGYAPQSILINEVMYDPNDNGTEWVEFVNVSNSIINLHNWMISEKSSSDDPDTLTNTDVLVNPGDYIIAADDTSGNKFSQSQNVHVFEVNFGELNSTEDVITLYDFRGAIIDSLEYFSSWGGGDGFSLERISLQSPTNLRSNWISSIVPNGSTPGISNSAVNVTYAERKQLVINEILFDPESGYSEFVELFNTSDQFIELANWSIEDEAKNNTVFSRTTISIAPNSYFIVAADSSILLAYPELKEFNQLVIANENMSLNNSNDLILLFNSFGEVIDSVQYSSQWHNSRLLTTKNKSLERINPFLDGNDDNNWSTSVASLGATPGQANSIYIDNETSGKTISVTPNPFSPDGDGYEDFTIINYKLPKAVSSIQIKVFDSKGRKVRTINENNIYSSNGSIIFDGYNDDGQPLKIGIYILLIEALDSSTGTTDTFKEVVVVARKL